MERRPASLSAHACALTCALATVACAPANLSRTLGAGNTELRAALGGPVFQNLGAPIPAPNLHLGGRVGLTDWMDLDGNLNLTATAFSLWAMDLAANFQLYRRPRGLAVATSARLFILGDLDDAPAARALPEVGLHLGAPLTRWLSLYGGVTSAAQFRAPEGKPPLFTTPFLGAEFLLPARGKPRQHGLALHAGWTNPWEDNNAVVNYTTSRGALALHLGYRVRFGGLHR
jgi:hypothetical protein